MEEDQYSETAAAAFEDNRHPECTPTMDIDMLRTGKAEQATLLALGWVTLWYYRGQETLAGDLRP